MRESLARAELPAGLLELRDIDAGDIEAFVRYWHYSGDQHLEFLNILPDKLGGPGDTRDRFRRATRDPGNNSPSAVAFSVVLDGRLIGYVNFNRHSPVENYFHFHLVDPAARGRGIGRIVFALAVALYFDLYAGDERVVVQIRTRVEASNRAVGVYLPIAETRFFADPDGLAGEGEFHMHHIRRSDVDWLRARGEEERQLLHDRDHAVEPDPPEPWPALGTQPH